VAVFSALMSYISILLRITYRALLVFTLYGQENYCEVCDLTRKIPSCILITDTMHLFMKLQSYCPRNTWWDCVKNGWKILAYLERMDSLRTKMGKENQGETG